MIDIRNLKIAVLMGGPGSERKVSHASGNGVADALRTFGGVVETVDVMDENFALPPGTDIAVNMIHGTFGEDGKVQRILESRGARYTGEGVAESELAIDKIASKRAFASAGVPSAAFEEISRGQQPQMTAPLVVKAPCEGSSVGVYIAKEQSEVADAVAKGWTHSATLLVEKFVQGRELTVGVVGDQVLPVVEICPPEGDYNFDTKYPFLSGAQSAKYLCPAPLDEAVTARVQAAALAAHRALGLRVYSRVDVLLSADGEPFVLEANTIPGMTPSSLLPKAAQAVGISYPDLCARIIELSFIARP